MLQILLLNNHYLKVEWILGERKNTGLGHEERVGVYIYRLLCCHVQKYVSEKMGNW